jgi:hypothetical protein
MTLKGGIVEPEESAIVRQWFDKQVFSEMDKYETIEKLL